MRRLTAVLAAVMLLIMLIPSALAVNYPAKTGTVYDTAGVLGEKTIEDIKALNQNYQEAAGGEIYVVTRHFLGGMEAAAYAAGLFESWGLKKYDVLLLMVIGEESYAVQYGEKAGAALKGETGAMLLGSNFRAPYLARNYDQAIANFLPAVTKAVAASMDETMSSEGLFGKETVSSTPAPQTENSEFNWSGFITAGDVDWSDYSEGAPVATTQTKVEKVEKDTGFSIGKLFVILLIFYFLFGRKGSKNKYNFRHPPRR